MMKEIKKEEPESEPESEREYKPEPIFHREDAYVLDGDDVPDGDLPQLPQILPRKRKLVKRRIGAKKGKRKTRKTKTGTRKRKSTKGRRKKRTTKKTTGDGDGKIGRVRKFREKEPKLKIRQNNDVIVMDEEPVRMPSPPPAPKPTPANILDQILGAQEKEFGVVKPGSGGPKPRVLSNGRRTVW